jgi:hypothetical protein
MTTTIPAWRKAKKLPLWRLNKLTIASESHTSRDEDLCALELVAWLAGEPHSDCPSCTCPVIAAMVRKLNYGITDDAMRTRLLGPILPLLLDTAVDSKVMRVRAYIAADYACREAAPIALEAYRRSDWASRLCGLAPIVDRATALVAQKVANEVADGFDVAAYAAYAAADAAEASATANAADYAGAYAAYAAAYAAHAVKGKEKIYQSAVDCIRRMCEMMT